MRNFLIAAILGLCCLILAPSALAVDVDTSPLKVELKKSKDVSPVIFITVENDNLSFEKERCQVLVEKTIMYDADLPKKFDTVGTGNYLRLYCNINGPSRIANKDPFHVELFTDPPRLAKSVL